MNLELTKEDIKNIGHTTFNEDGNTDFICDGTTYNIESILLRNILKCFGDEYKMLSTEDYNKNDILIKTNLPFEEYMSL